MADGGSLMGSLFPSLVLFVGGPILIWWLRRKRPAALSGLRVSARTALTRNSVVAVVETGSRRFLLGATDHGVEMLAELEPGEQPIDDMEDIQGALLPEGPRTSPLETLRAMTTRRAGKPRPFHAHRP